MSSSIVAELVVGCLGGGVLQGVEVVVNVKEVDGVNRSVDI